MTRIGVGGLINLDRIHQAQLLLSDIHLFHQHAAAAAVASSSSAADSASRPTPYSDECCSPDTAELLVSSAVHSSAPYSLRCCHRVSLLVIIIIAISY